MLILFIIKKRVERTQRQVQYEDDLPRDEAGPYVDDHHHHHHHHHHDHDHYDDDD